jgi:hypothetical protein
MKAKPGVTTQNFGSKPHTHGGVPSLPKRVPKAEIKKEPKNIGAKNGKRK